ncbi:hypothetical protein ACFYYD_33375 [Streptomyces bluensis]|uniref:hypothetical protein n=1 Tax=Streptomyces bluensis TaxID=33897 RepID=UPI0036B7E283
MTVLDSVLSGVAGVVLATAATLGYTWHKDRRDRNDREAAEARRREERSEKERAGQQERRQEVSAHYLSCLGTTFAALDAVLVDASNADELIRIASDSYGELQGIGQGKLVTLFGADSPVVWADRAMRRILDDALVTVRQARSQGQTGDAAQQTSYIIRQLTRTADRSPRDLMRWTLDEATKRWPQPLECFEGHWQFFAQNLAQQTGLALPDKLVMAGQTQ